MFSGLLKLFGYNKQRKNKQDDPPLDEIRASVQHFKNRPIYKKLTKKIIDAIPNDQLEQAIFDNIWESIGNDYGHALKAIQKLTRGQQAIFATWIVEGEVSNGGFNQFYFNSSGAYADLAADGFETLGAMRFASLMRQANALYLSIEGDLEKYQDGTLESFSESYNDNPLNDLDDQFYDLYRDEPLKELKINYIRNHIHEFL